MLSGIIRERYESLEAKPVSFNPVLFKVNKQIGYLPVLVITYDYRHRYTQAPSVIKTFYDV